MKKMISLSLLCISISCYAAPLKKMTTDDYLDLVEPHIPSNPIILEAGARWGQDTTIMSQRWPRGTIHSFEPVPRLFDITYNTVKSLSNVNLYQLALSNTIGTEKFYVSQNNDGAGSLLAPTQAIQHLNFAKEPITVSVTTIDAWAEEQGVDHIDFMWLDMEGGELRTLQASPKIMSTVIAIITEINDREFRKGTPNHKEVKKWFKEQGFYEAWGYIIPHGQGNALFVRNGY